MKKIILLLLLFTVISAKGQSIAYQQAYTTYGAYKTPLSTAGNYIKIATGIDTTFEYKAASINLNVSTVTINGATYSITNPGDIKTDRNNDYWQSLTLNGNIECTLHRYPNYAIMNVTLITTDNNSIIYYIL